MMLDLFIHEWASLCGATLAATLNLYLMRADSWTSNPDDYWRAVATTIETGKPPGFAMGSLFRRYRPLLEFMNWVLLVGLLVFLGYNYSWFLLLTIWVFPVLGSIIASILKERTQIIYIVAMPILLVAFIVRVA